MARTPRFLRRSRDDDDRALAVSSLVETLVGKATPRLVRPLPRWEDIVSAVARPGTGGRRKRVDVGFEIEATRELRERYGAPQELPYRGSLLLIWEMDDDGDGIIAARLSSQDVQKGETAMGQIHNGIALAATHRLKPACAVVAMRTSGGADYDDRLDFTFIRDRIATQSLSWVAYREPDRIARELHSAHSFYKFLRDTRTDLYLCSLGRKVDWNSQSDRLMVSTLGVIGEFERGAIKARTHNAIKARWLEEGRGYPGFKPIGFRRTAQMFLEQDPEQWPYIRQAAAMYSRLRPDGGTSIRGLAEFLTDTLGFTISRERVRTMLKHPIYVTGMAHVTYEGTVYPLRPIELVDPVPADTFNLNQDLMSTVKGRQRTNPLGHFLLNRVDFRHDACQHVGDDDGWPVRLRCERNSYTHDRRCPLPECRRFALPHKQLDAAVVAELLRLCEDEHLQREYQTRARTTASATPTGVLTPAQQRSFQTRVTDLQRQREEIARRWLQVGPQNLDPRYLQESLEQIDAEITRLQRQIELSQRLLATQGKHSSDRDELLQRAREILTPEPPDDPELRQRRMIFVQQALSKVIARRTKTGFELELHGPLIPADAAPLHFDPLEHARPVLQNGTDPEGLPWRSVPRWRGSCGPIWQSRPIRVPCPFVRERLGPASREQAREAIRVMSGEGRPSPIRELLDRGLVGRDELVSLPRILRYAQLAGTTLDEETRVVLGAEEALRLRRVAPASRADWQLIVGWALDEGMSFERGWVRRWDVLNTRVGWMGSHRRLVKAQQQLDFKVGDLIETELAARGLPAPVFDHRPGRGRDTRFEACLEALREAARAAPPGRLSWATLRVALNDRDDLPTAKQINNMLHQRGVSKDAALRLALGRTEALVSGRVVARTRAEWVTVMGAAIDAGYRAGRGWSPRWDALHRCDPRFVSASTIRPAALRHGGFAGLYAHAMADRTRMSSRREATTNGTRS